MTQGWRYFAERLNGDGTSTPLQSDLPLQDVSIEKVLSGPNSLNATIAPEIARLKGSDGSPLLDEWSTVIYAEKDSVIRGAGILAFSGFEKATWALECVGFIGYWKGMPYTGSGQFFVEADTLDITRSILTHVQSQPGGNLGLLSSPILSGRRVGAALTAEEYDPEGGAADGGLELETQAYKLAYYQDHDLLENINGLASDSPFDYIEEHRYGATGIEHHLHFGVPTIGRRRGDLRFAIGENVYVIPSVERDGSEYASEVHTLGAGEGAKMIRGIASTGRGHRLRRVAVESRSDLRTTAAANSHSRTSLQWRHRLENVESIVVRDHPHAPIGSYDVGDEILLTGDAGWHQVNQWCRIISLTIMPDNPGSIELTVQRSDRLT